jgi:hypothetical protein
MTTPTDAETVAKMLQGVSPGPWTADVTDPSDVVVWASPGPQQNDELIANIGHTFQPVRVAFDCDAANARFIAWARDAVPALAARVADVGEPLEHWIDEAFKQRARAETAEARITELEAIIAGYKDGTIPDLTAAYAAGGLDRRDEVAALRARAGEG